VTPPRTDEHRKRHNSVNGSRGNIHDSSGDKPIHQHQVETVNRRLSFHWLFATGLAFVAEMIASGVLAQNCDDRFPWTCQEFRSRPSELLPPAAPLRPAETTPTLPPSERSVPPRPGEVAVTIDPDLRRQYAALYAPVSGERFPIPEVRLSGINPEYLRTAVSYPTHEQPGTVVIDPRRRFLYLVQGGGRALRYGAGVGRQGFGWAGVATIQDKQEWPDWYPPKEMIQRQPELRRQLSELQGGLGMPGGSHNPLGSRAMYLWQGNKDTLYRIHGTNEPWTIGSNVSSGCIRMINQDVIDLYRRTPIGAKVVVLSQR
jgi:lipoprotein-anchoring transpeptidase ErfK/SrfK